MNDYSRQSRRQDLKAEASGPAFPWSSVTITREVRNENGFLTARPNIQIVQNGETFTTRGRYIRGMVEFRWAHRCYLCDRNGGNIQLKKR